MFQSHCNIDLLNLYRDIISTSAEGSEIVDDHVLRDVVHLSTHLKKQFPLDEDCDLKRLLSKVPVSIGFNLCAELLMSASSCCVMEFVASYCIHHDELKNMKECWNDILFDWPYKIEKRICRQFDHDSLGALAEATNAMKLYNFAVDDLHCYRFPQLLKSITQAFQPSDHRMFEFFMVAAGRFPFHPFLVSHKSGFFIPSVYSPSFLVRSLIVALTEYLSESNDNMNGFHVESVIATMNVVLKLADQFCSSDSECIEAWLFSFLPFIQNFDLGEKRVVLLKQCESLLLLMDSSVEVLIVKRIVERLAVSRNVQHGSSLLLAWLIDIYRTNLCDPLFKAELGSFWVFLEKLRFERPAEAVSYYNSVLILAQLQALQKFNCPMLYMVKTRILDGIREQLRDNVELEKMKASSESDITSDAKRSLDLILFNIDYTYKIISEIV